MMSRLLVEGHPPAVRAGIPLDAATWEELVTAGEAMGLARAQAQAIAGPVPD